MGVQCACSTITYDTLVRAGIECTSAFVPKGLSPYGSSDTSPALAICSRQVKILPDVTLDPLDAGPVCISELF
jgi:protein DJ-1